MRLREALLPVPIRRRHPHLRRWPDVLRTLPHRLRLQDLLGLAQINRQHSARGNPLRAMSTKPREPQLPERELSSQGLPERDPELKSDNQARIDELSNDAGQIAPDSAGQSGGSEGLSDIQEASDESVEELAGSGQALESDALADVEYAADHPEKPVPTHERYPRAA